MRNLACRKCSYFWITKEIKCQTKNENAFVTINNDASGALTGVCLPQVRDGARVSQDLPNYWDRVQTHSLNIEIKNVNHSDEGYYTLRDRRDRVVSVTRMDLTGGSPYTLNSQIVALVTSTEEGGLSLKQAYIRDGPLFLFPSVCLISILVIF